MIRYRSQFPPLTRCAAELLLCIEVHVAATAAYFGLFLATPSVHLGLQGRVLHDVVLGIEAGTETGELLLVDASRQVSS